MADWLFAAPLQPRRRALPLLCVFILVAGVLASGCLSGRTAGDGQPMATLGRVTRGRLVVSISATGQVVAGQAQEVRAESSGTVISVLAREGDRVEAGQVLAELENADVVTQASLARLDVADAEAELAELCAQGELKGSVFRKALVADSPGRVVSVASGVVQSAQVRAQAPLLTLAAPDRIDLVVEVTYTERQQLGVGSRAEVFPKDFTGSLEGRVSWVADAPVTSPESYRYQVGIGIDQPGLVREGGRASAHIFGPGGTVVRDGVFRWADARVVTAPFDGLLSRLEVQAGEVVSAGQLLAVVESDQVPKKLEALQRELERRRLVLDQRAKALAGLTITAPVSGVLSGFAVEVGQRLQAGQTLGRILAEGPLEVEAAVDETQVAQVRNGLKAEVILEAIPGRAFLGRVESVAVEGQPKGGTTAYASRIVLEEPVPGARPGMTAQASILVAEKSGVLLVPIEALVEEGGRTMVRVPAQPGEGAPFRLQPVEVGLRSDSQAEIISGLSEGDAVVVAIFNPEQAPDFMRPGMFGVRIRRSEGGGTRPAVPGHGGGGGQ
ncbi:MAG: efflux RND transporter periplasmic adaptor subunit [Acetobacteraceae bacterium]|nr:efflux RND transporter periplasmic adaptor subunit [Acetobacteraceae bacterium]